MSRNQILLIVIGGILILVGIPLTLYLVSQQQDPRSRASDVTYPDSAGFTQQQPTSTAQTQQSCETPSSPTNTDISYPHVSGDEVVDYEAANCAWDSVEGASGYNLKITDVNTGEVVRDEQVPSSTNLAVFPITQGNEYLCEVSTVNDCGAVSAVSSDQQICETEAFISPSPSPQPTQPPAATGTPAPTQPQATATPTTTVKPPPPPTGTTETLLIGGGIAAIVISLGAAMLIW